MPCWHASASPPIGGRLYGRVGDRARAREELDRAAAMLRVMQMLLWLSEAQTRLATLA
jgi:hypothetical protein